MARQFNGELVLTVRAARNRQVHFPPTDTVLESEWRASEDLGAPEVIRELGVIPRNQIIVDRKERKLIIRDLMNDATPEFDKRVRAAFASEQAGFNGRFRYAEDEVHDLRSRDDMATCLYWLRRLVETKKLALECGDLPEYDAIRKMGNVRIANSDEGIRPLPGQDPVNVLPRIVGDVKDLASAGAS